MSDKRKGRAACAADTLEIIERGSYTTATGRTIDLRERHAASLRSTYLCRQDTTPPVATAPKEAGPAVITLSDETTMQAMQRLTAAGLADLGCLNFASAKNPGGGFLGGAQAQEECLARSSTLYPTLLTQPDYYATGRATKSCLYEDIAIVSPDVIFLKDDSTRLLDEPYAAIVVTCPAPNAGAVRANEPTRAADIEPTLRRRAEFVLRVAVHAGIRSLVLGAWGCGVFRNDPTVVASIFAELLSEAGPYARAFEHVHFAVYDPSPARETYEAFARAIPTTP